MTNIKRDIRVRVYLAFILMCLCGSAIIGRAAWLQLVQGKQLRALSKKATTRVATLEAERGNIYSEDGALLSSSIPEFDIYVDFNTIQKDTFSNNVKALSKAMSELFADHTESEYINFFKKAYATKSRYYQIKKKTTYGQYMAMRKFPIFKLGPNKGGFIADDVIKRSNPFKLLGNRMIGTFRTNGPSVGLEASYNAELSGQQGHRVEQKIAGDVWMPLDGSEVEAQNGRDIITNIDVNTQDIAENALLRVLTKEEAAWGTCIVMETKTGKIKALANLGRQQDGSYWEDFNYALSPIEPGSTFKMLGLMSAIDDGYMRISDHVNANGGVCYFANQKMSDSHLGMGDVSLEEAFSHSSNVACAKVVYSHYQKNPKQYLDHLQLCQVDKPTGIDIAGERKPQFKHTNGGFKNPATLAWLAIGYEIGITPMRTCMVYNAVANGGTMMKPYIVSEVRDFGQTIKTFTPTVVEKQVCKPSTVEQLKQAAFAVVQSGTGKALKNDVYTICGKTGTAQVADKGIKYSDGVYHGSFVGFFPKENPLYTICVVVRTKRGANNYYGGQIALPVFKEVADRLYANSIKQHPVLQKDTVKYTASTCFKGMDVSNMQFLQSSLHCFPAVGKASGYVAPVLDSNGNTTNKFFAAALHKMPSLCGLGLRDALLIAEKQGLRVTVQGKGKILAQSIAANATINKGQIVHLTLSE